MSATIYRFPAPQPAPRPPMPLDQVLPILPQMLAQIARRVAHDQPRQLATAHAELAALADYFTQISGGRHG
ncbi:hypothetical protein [Methylomagnum ishizawai]|uniref:hypothetical protein n=1 Tax=Methylomagnum ishizawai TaxID=1760988 RepID=UPI001C33F726|nr:hypothetical protein [Methylomagnum ishizawai]BBL73989.1 hypothetical protein MishRS11D_10870 [Methylomagnum ishizawai]